MTDLQTLLALYVASGLLLVAVSIPMIRGRVKPNWIYGFKVRKTVENPGIWYPANAYAGKWLLGCGVLTVVAAIAFSSSPTSRLTATRGCARRFASAHWPSQSG